MSFPSLAAVKSIYTLMARGQTDELAKKLTKLIEMLHSSLLHMRDQYAISGYIESYVEIPQNCPKSPIISLLTPNPRSLAQHCQRSGYMVRAIVPPTVPEGFERVRICLHAGNTFGQIEGFVQILQQWIDVEGQERSTSSGHPRARL